MHADRLRQPLKRLCRALSPPDGGALSDGHLQALFLADRDEAAFAALVRRHGPMVLGVCRRLVRHAQDAEDCFQAAFLVLARRAGSVRSGSLASWLYGVAYRVALRCRRTRASKAASSRVATKCASSRPSLRPPPSAGASARRRRSRGFFRRPACMSVSCPAPCSGTG